MGHGVRKALVTLASAEITAEKIGDDMAQQLELRTHDDFRAPDVGRRDLDDIVHDLTAELTTIRSYASLGGDASYDAELTESYFALIESAGKRAAQITAELMVVDSPPRSRPELPPVHTTTDPRRAPTSSFRRRLGLTS